jgi:fructose-1-phosphate kinase PfkB-like protein
MNKSVTIGFSINPEIIPEFDRMTQSEKAELYKIECSLGGTSANVAKAIYNLSEIKPEVLALTSEDERDFNTNCLRFASEDYPIHLCEIPIMNKSNIALIPIDGLTHSSSVWGFKGKINKEKIGAFLENIRQKKSTWKIATGVRPEEFLFAEALFSGDGCKSLNPKENLIVEKDLFFSLLKRTDLLILNMREYELFTQTHNEINSMGDMINLGPKMIIVTNGEKGGKFHIKNKTGELREKFSSVTSYQKLESGVYATGTGDWFNGGFTSYCLNIGKTIDDIDGSEVQSAINFAAKVGGKKVTMLGASNGPSKLDL